MASLLSLPNELLSRIAQKLESRSELSKLRLINKRLNAIAAPIYFSNIALYPHYEPRDPPDGHGWDEGYTDTVTDFLYNAQNFKNILDHVELKGMVKKVIIYTSDPQLDLQSRMKDPRYNEFAPYIGLKPIWWNCLERILEFPKLKELVVSFDRHCGFSSTDYEEIFARDVFRSPILEKFIDVVKGDQEGRITHLAFQNLQNAVQLFSCAYRNNPGDSSPEGDEYRKKVNGWAKEVAIVFSKLKSLRLNVAHEDVDSRDDVNLASWDVYGFWRKLPRALQYCTTNLQSLTLYSDIPFGFFPVVDLRSVHFPQLRHLALGQFTFGKDWQFDWIISHTTLASLFLDACSIMYVILDSWQDWEWLDKYSEDDTRKWEELMEDYHLGQLNLIRYQTRWHEVFARFQYDLPNLKDFNFGSSDTWVWNTLDRLDNPRLWMPMMPFENEGNFVGGKRKAELKVGKEEDRDEKREDERPAAPLFKEMYLVWNGVQDTFEVRITSLENRWGRSLPKHITEYLKSVREPGCEVEDRNALEALSEASRRRK